MEKLINWIKKFGGYLLTGIGAIGTIAGLFFLAMLRNNKVDDKIEQLNKEHELEKEKMKDEKIINGNNYNSYNPNGTLK